ncbi:hypothetical protein GOP47_0029214 [Adiantum capillus-veneris]|nr:hypothetical protein GOP47_0029214 [Adiantum capillus-veneris]
MEIVGASRSPDNPSEPMLANDVVPTTPSGGPLLVGSLLSPHYFQTSCTATSSTTLYFASTHSSFGPPNLAVSLPLFTSTAALVSPPSWIQHGPSLPTFSTLTSSKNSRFGSDELRGLTDVQMSDVRRGFVEPTL